MFDLAMGTFTEINNKKGMASVSNSMGNAYLNMSDNSRAMEYYLIALKAYEELHDKAGMAAELSNIGIVHLHLGNYASSLEYHKNAITIYEELHDKKGLSNTFGNIGNTYDEMDSSPKALEFYQKALNISTETGYTYGIASNISNMGVVYNKQGHQSKALEYYKSAITFWEQLHDKYNTSFMLYNIGSLYLNAPDSLLLNSGMSLAKRYDSASQYLNNALRLSADAGALDVQGDVWRQLSVMYEKKKDAAKALDAFKKYTTIKDSISNDANRQDITRKEMQYNFDKKEAISNATHQAEIKQQQTVKYAVMSGAGILLLSGFISFVFYKRRRDANEEKKEADFKAQVSDTEMKVLRLQMNPHFIFNSLNSISDYVQKHDIKAADNYLSKFAKVMRLTLEYSEQKAITLAEDLKALELYMQLESSRLDNKFTFEIKVDKSIDAQNTLVPPMILQPFVENSIWHGISKIDGKGKILIEIKKEEGMINCIVEDNGAGLPPGHHSSDKKSLGMKITKARIEIMNKIKKSKAGVQLFNREQGVRVEVKLPLELSF
jgi:tetratricopeptide (TPR) repeat protein/two-component sensor histidine kinase